VERIFCLCGSDSILTPLADPTRHAMQQLETGQRLTLAPSLWTPRKDLIKPNRHPARNGRVNTSLLAARARLPLTWKWLVPTTRGRSPSPWDRIGPTQSPKTPACSTTSRLQEGHRPHTRPRRSFRVNGQLKPQREVSSSLRSLSHLLVSQLIGLLPSHSILNVSNQDS
jgi:hypothetical protein